MADENELGVGPDGLADLGTGGLFTDNENSAPMLSGGPEFDGAPASGTPAPEEVEGKGGKKLLRVDLGNGHFVVAETERELLEKVVKGKIEADKTILAREGELKAMRERPAPIPQQAPPARTPAEAFDGQKYLTMLGNDPLEAIKYANQYTDGGGNPAANERIDYAYNVAQRVDQQLMAAEFHRRNPDWQPTDENASKLLTVLNANGLSPTLPHLEWGKQELIRTGAYSPAPSGDGITYEDITFGEQQPQAPRRQGRGNPPPIAPKGGKQNEPDVMNAETMPLQDLEAMLRKKGALH